MDKENANNVKVSFVFIAHYKGITYIKMDKIEQKHNELYGIGESKNYRNFWISNLEISPLWIVEKYIKMGKIELKHNELYGIEEHKISMII